MRIDEDGKPIAVFGLLRIVLFVGEVKCINILGDSIYYAKYNEESHLFDAYEFKIHQSKEKLIMENCDFINVIEDDMFYLSQVDDIYLLYKKNLQDENIMLLSKEPCLNYLIESDRIYFVSKSGIFLMDSDGKHFRKVLDILPISYFVFENYLYYSVYESKSGMSIIYKLLRKGSKYKVISIKDEIKEFFVKSDRITYLNKLGNVKVVSIDDASLAFEIHKGATHIYIFNDDKTQVWKGKDIEKYKNENNAKDSSNVIQLRRK